MCLCDFDPNQTFGTPIGDNTPHVRNRHVRAEDSAKLLILLSFVSRSKRCIETLYRNAVLRPAYRTNVTAMARTAGKEPADMRKRPTPQPRKKTRAKTSGQLGTGSLKPWVSSFVRSRAWSVFRSFYRVCFDRTKVDSM